MVKLIGHYYNAKKGSYITYEIKDLKETEKQYSRPASESRRASYEYWAVMPKTELRKLRGRYGNFYMYDSQENLILFKELVIAELSQNVVAKKAAYDKALQMLETAQELRALNCKICGAKMVWGNPYIPGHWHESSCYLGDNWPICDECMDAHCESVKCLNCEYGAPSDCRFYDDTKFYRKR